MAIRIPNSFLEKSKLEKDTVVDLTAEDGMIVIQPAVSKPIPALDELLAQITPESLHGEVNWGPPVGQEVW